MSLNYTFEATKAEYAHMWAHMEIKPSRLDVAQNKAKLIIKGKATYQQLQLKTNVPWYFIGLLHLRESDCDFNTHLHNGDPLTRRTVHVPPNRPIRGTPPFSFEFSAIDALEQKGYHKITDWSIERMAYCLEKYNGWGYRYRNVPSAYLWASSNQYRKGKFVKDSVFNPNVVDTQLGAMVVLKVLLDMEQLVPESAAPVITDETPNTPTAEIPRPTNNEMAKTSRKWRATDLLHWLTGGTGATVAAAKTLDASNIQATKSYVDVLKSFAKDYGVEMVIVLCILAFGVTMLIRKLMKDDVQDGRALPSGKVEQ
jgi:lysozyme family protein